MTQQEFEQRVGMSVNATEYASIENVYMASDLDKDAFCILWEKMNFKRVARAKEERVAKLKEQMKKEQLFDILNKPYGKNEFGTLADKLLQQKRKSCTRKHWNPHAARKKWYSILCKCSISIG